MLKGILFDMGGVLLNLDLAGCVRRFKEKLGFEDVEKFLSTTHHKGFVSDLEQGLIGKEEFLMECRRHCRVGVSDEEILECFYSLVVDVDEDKAEYIKELYNRKEYDLFILSNTNGVAMGFNSGCFDKAGIPLDKYFKKQFLSYEMKMLKPDHEFYEETARRTGYKPEELLFIDDSQANVQGAKECGINAVYYKIGTSLKDTVDGALASLK